MTVKLYAVFAAAMTFARLAASFPALGDSAAADRDDEHRHHSRASKSYHFKYAVHDPATGDEKSHNEVGDGHGTVRGAYGLVEPDGSVRAVEYTADDVHGFRAEVKKIRPPRKPSSAAEHAHFGLAAEHEAPHFPDPANGLGEHYRHETISSN